MPTPSAARTNEDTPTNSLDRQRPNLAPASLPKSVLAAAGTAFVVRMAGILIARSYLFAPRVPGGPGEPPPHWNFGYEMGRVAASVALGHGFGSPFHGLTGPTAWQPPAYPYLLAGIFQLFGVYSQTSGMIALTLNCLAAACTTVLIYRIAERLAGREVALWSAWIFTIFPTSLEFAVFWAWETCISTLMLTAAFWLTLTLSEKRGIWQWLKLGVLWGAIALTNPSLLAVMPFMMAWAWWRSIEPGRTWYFVVVFALLFAMIMPWNIRDRLVMGKWMLMRDNFWAEVSYGNGENAKGIWMGWQHPGTNPVELERYAAEGELNYIDGRRLKVQAFIRRNPRYFANLTLRHALMFWFDPIYDFSDDLQPSTILFEHTPVICFSSLAFIGLILLWRRNRAPALLFAPAMLVYPWLYYITSPHPRYRHPIEPVMLVLAVFAIIAARDGSLRPDATGLNVTGSNCE